MRTFVIDLVERVVWTYVEAFCALLLLSWAANVIGGQVTAIADWSIVTKAAIGAVAAAVAVIKNIAAGFLGNPDSAATVPRRVDHKGLSYAPVPNDVALELAFHSNVADGGGQRLGFDPHGTPLPMTKISDRQAEQMMAHGPKATRPVRKPRR